MSDIVKRLRDAASNPAIWTLTQEAADAIEAQDAEIERLRAKLGPLVEERVCVLCGRTEPCMTDEKSLAAGGPGAPCTFDPTAQQLWDTNVRLRAESAAFEQAWKDACARAEQTAEELAALKALLREADTEITTWMYHGHGSTESGFGSAPLLNRIRAALGDDPTS